MAKYEVILDLEDGCDPEITLDWLRELLRAHSGDGYFKGAAVAYTPAVVVSAAEIARLSRPPGH